MYWFIALLIMPPACCTPFNHNRAMKAGQLGNWEACQELLQKTLVDHHDDPSVLYDLGVASYKREEYQKAATYFQKVATSPVASKELREKAHYNAGNTQVKLKNLDHALDAYENALSLNPGNEQVAHNKEIVKKMKEEQERKEQEEQNKKDQNEDQNENKNNDQDDKNKDKKDGKDQDSNSGDQKDNDQKSDSQDKKNETNDQQGSESNQPDNDPNDDLPDNQDQKQNQKQDQQKNKKKQDEKRPGNDSAQKGDTNQERDGNDQKKDGSSQQEKGDGSGSGSACGDDKEQEVEGHPALDPMLARLLEQQEENDAQTNKKMIKALVTQERGYGDQEHCW